MAEIKRLAAAGIALTIITGFGLDSIANLAVDIDSLEQNGFSLGLIQAVHVYLIMPIIVASSALFILGPGFQLALMNTSSQDGFGGWVLKGFVFSVLIVCGVSAITQWMFMDRLLTSGYFYLLLLVLNTLSFIWVFRADHRGTIDWQLFSGRGFESCLLVLTPMLVLALLSGKFYWENFNGDGAHSLLSAQLMVVEGMPFWTAEAGGIGSYPSMTTMLEVFLNSWFVRLFGPHEFSARAIFLLGLGLVFALILEFIRFGRDEKLSRPTVLCTAAALVLYSFILAYNTSYGFYFADIALPMGREPVIVLVFLGFAYFFLTSQFLWMGIYALLIYITVPSGPFFILAWLGAMLLLWRPVPFRALLYGGVSLVIAVLIGKSIPAILVALSIINGADEFSAGNLLERLRYVSFQNWERLAYWALPTGILPALAVLAWWWQDRLTRVIALVTLGYVCLFYFQAYRVLPHHFAPPMLLSLIVLWRLKPMQAVVIKRWAAVPCLTGIALAAWVSWPPVLKSHSFTRHFAQSVFMASPETRTFDGGQIYIFHELMRGVFPGGWTEEQGEKYYIFSPLSWYYYASSLQGPSENTVYWYDRVNVAPVGTVVSQLKGYQLSVTDMAKYEIDRINPGIKRSINDLYFVERKIIFGKGEKWGERRVVDLARLPAMIGLR